MEDARLPLRTNLIRGPTEERAVVQGSHGRVGNHAVTPGGGKATLGNVDSVCSVIKHPLEGIQGGVGFDGAVHFGVFVATDRVRGDLTG